MIILGSTGSIGINTLIIAKKLHLEIETLCAGKNISLLNQQILEFKPKNIVIADKQDIPKITKHFNGKIYYGENGILEAILDSKSTLVVNALVGFLGLKPTLYAINAGKTIALANKESLVVGGEFIDTSKIIPIDSEHFSLAYLMNFDSQIRPFKNLYITASGGAFRDTPLEEIPLQNATNALKHPNWKMGKKITIDSATMVNKLFEVLEAHWLFKTQNIDAYIERNSQIHALVEFWDGSVVAHFANANMQLPIAYAITYGLGLKEEFLQSFSHSPLIPSINFVNQNYTLEPICTKRYPLWNLKNSLLENPKLGVILNAANEVAVEAFLCHTIPFGEIVTIIQKTLDYFHQTLPNSLNEVFALDFEVRKFAQNLL